MSIWRTLFNRHSETFRIKHKGKTFEIPRRDGADYILEKMEKRGSFYEPELLNALAGVCTGTGIALDCGANVGNHTLFFAGVMGLDVHAFEPIPQNAAILQHTVGLNDLSDRVAIVNAALGDAEGEVTLALSHPSNPGMYAVTDTADGIKAKVVTIDAYLASKQIAPDAVALMKVDVEGHEMPVLRGAAQLLEKGRPVLAIELAGRAMFDPMAAFLQPFGYQPVGVYCHTPTVIFQKAQPDAALLSEITQVQDAFDARQAAS